MFALVCFLIMLPMIFSVPLLYVGMLPHSRQQPALLSMSSALMVAIACWVVFGNDLAFGTNLLQADSFSALLNGLVQMDFYLYAIAMLIGTVVAFKHSRYFLVFVPVWTALVYCPLAHWLWADGGWLQQLGALDFSGGIVVHLTAGLTSLVLARALVRSQEAIAANDFRADYAATIMILVGWLGFNLAPVGSLNAQALQVLVKTLVAVMAAMAGWSWSVYRRTRQVSLGDLLNGVLCGLVTSTALVGYVGAGAMAVVAVVSGGLCQTAVVKMQQTKRYYDAVDSFAINAVGGLTGVVGLILVRLVTREDGVRFAGVELLAVFVAIILTVVGTVLAQAAAHVSETGLSRWLAHDRQRLDLRKEKNL
ncbi:ammonium transporter [Lacticaseibacillus chiayiensis]|uniref:ammonium transporter n=1 Tax=Lacticaseibacillus chiayiensis TaxID=2100821 RepID=UPI00101356DA|nr:ammonium transporter [Lacticaseibacillus chiayiensis]RXT56775.1 ammonium transporter [Lacticaseibacillus chiayiensis]